MAVRATASETLAELRKPLPERLRDVGCDRAPFTPEHAECVCRLTNEAADVMERMRSCFDTMQKAIEREGYDVLINIDGTEVSLRRREQQ